MFGRRDNDPRPAPPGCLLPTAANRGGIGPAVLKNRPGAGTLMVNTTQSISTVELEQTFWTDEQRAEVVRIIQALIAGRT